MTQELEFRIVVNNSTKISIEKFDDGVWFHLLTRNGTMYTTMSIDQAKEMIEALTKIVEAK